MRIVLISDTHTYHKQINLPEGTKVYLDDAPGVNYIWQGGKLEPDINRIVEQSIEQHMKDLAFPNREVIEKQKKTISIQQLGQDDLPDQEVLAQGKPSSATWYMIILFIVVAVIVIIYFYNRKLKYSNR